MWVLRFVQHDKEGACASLSITGLMSFCSLFSVIPNAVRNAVRVCFASLSMTKREVWMLH